MKDIIHPDYNLHISDWIKFRDVFEGGFKFIANHVAQFSQREDSTDFESRKSITYCPAHAKAVIIDIRNAIYQRMVDIRRQGGTQSYQNAVIGLDGGVY